MRSPLVSLLLAISIVRPAAACADQGTSPEATTGERPLLSAKEAVQRAVFDNCFLAGTNVETASRGGVNVEDVRVGDRVAPPPGHSCEDPRCGEVVRLYRNATDQVVTITAVARPRAREHRASGSGGEESGGEESAEPPSSSQTIRCTPGHPFFVEGRGWVFAGDLRAGDELEARGERVVVTAVEVRAERAETFNFEVACHHTYRVSGAAGQPGVLVHNMSVIRYARSPKAAALAARQRARVQNLRSFRAPALSSRVANARGGVSPGDIQGARPMAGRGWTAGHWTKHSADRPGMADLLNNPGRVFFGRNAGGRPVDVYFRGGSAVITEAGAKSRVITAYGSQFGSSAVDPARWAGSRFYAELDLGARMTTLTHGTAGGFNASMWAGWR